MSSVAGKLVSLGRGTTGEGADMGEALPFSKQNRPWLTDECIEAMNDAYLDCMSKIETEYRSALKEWAASMVEIGYLVDHPEVMEICQQWDVQYRNNMQIITTRDEPASDGK
jgi:hypothetical protein